MVQKNNPDNKKIFKFRTYYKYLQSLMTIIFYEFCLKDFPQDENKLSEINILEKIYRKVLDSQSCKITVKDKNFFSQKRGKIRRIPGYSESIKTKLYQSWIAECELNDPLNKRIFYIFNLEKNPKYLNRRMYSNWKGVYLYYSTLHLIDALIFIITHKMPTTHSETKNLFYEHVFKKYKNKFYIYPFNIECNSKNYENLLGVEVQGNEIIEELKSTGIISLSILDKFLKWFLNPKPEIEISRWIKNRFKDNWTQEYRRRKKNPNSTIRFKKDFEPSTYTFLHCFYDFRVWSSYYEVEPFVYGLKISSKKRLVIDISFSWITAVFNLMSEAIIFNIIPKTFKEISESFQEDISSYLQEENCNFATPIIMRHKLIEQTYHAN